MRPRQVPRLVAFTVARTIDVGHRMLALKLCHDATAMLRGKRCNTFSPMLAGGREHADARSDMWGHPDTLSPVPAGHLGSGGGGAHGGVDEAVAAKLA